MRTALIIFILALPQQPYVRKPFMNGRGQRDFQQFTYKVPLTLDANGEAVIRYASLYPGERYTQACQPDEETRDKTVRFFAIDEDADHVHVGTEPKKSGMKVTYTCSVQVKTTTLQRSTQ